MRLICPSCGAMHSAESWQNDPQARQCLKLIGELPNAVSTRCPAYLALFRPSIARGLAWSKVLRLLAEIQEQIHQPFIQWEGKAARPNSAVAWAQAMERITDRPPKSLPLKSHGYLRSIAYEIADEMDKLQERGQITEDRRQHNNPSSVICPPSSAVVYSETPERLTLSPEKLRAIREKNMKRRSS
jgi:hypothetical protein